MQQIKTLWAGLDKRKQLMVIFAACALIAILFVMSRMASAPSMKLLYAGLENGSAGDVVRALEQRGTQYEVRGGSIYVPGSERDELRMTLASEGLPANGGRGYELLDSLNGFGTTSQMFDAAYWRAKEGELARTIVASPHIAQARVHIAHNGSSPFQRSVEPTASVSIVPSGAPVTPAQANALRFLIASAVAGLSIENVAIIDANGALIGTADNTNTGSNADDRASLLRERVLRLVEARVGSGNAVVEVSVDTVTQTESIRERRFDPEGRVAISTDTEERTDTSSNAANGDVTVASNLPDGDASQGEGSKAQASETRERINYEVSETEHEIVRTPGDIKRLTVAVLVNGLSTTEDSGAPVFQPRTDEELDALRELVASAVGYDEARGDVITLKSMEMPALTPLGTSAPGGFLSSTQLDFMSLVQVAALAIVALVLGLFVIRPILTNKGAISRSDTAALPPMAPEPDTSNQPSVALTGEIEDGNDPRFAPESIAAPRSDAGLPAPVDTGETPVERLRSLIGDRQEETVEILRGWLEESKEKAQ